LRRMQQPKVFAIALRTVDRQLGNDSLPFAKASLFPQ
jgi:hypothetical protein